MTCQELYPRCRRGEQMGKNLLLLAATVLMLGFQSTSCSNHDSSDEMIHVGPDKLTSLVVFFKKDATRENIETFNNEVISVWRPDIKGRYDLPPGVAVSYSLRNGGYEGVGITFSTDATPEQRNSLKSDIKESPLVYKVYENVVPSEIQDLEKNQ